VPDDPITAALAEIRERRWASMGHGVSEPRPTARQSSDDVPRLLAVADAALELARRWNEQAHAKDPYVADVEWADPYAAELREVIARELLACGQCEGGLVPAGGCNCGSPVDASVNFAHERLCGYEPCPNGCWDRLHPAVKEAS
jgi:hypothetical protein